MSEGDMDRLCRGDTEGIEPGSRLFDLPFCGGRTPLGEAARKGDHRLMQDLLDLGAATDGTDLAGTPPLIHAIHGSQRGIVRVLLNEGADANRSDADGTTPLMHALYRGNLEIAGLLLAKGARTTDTDHHARSVRDHAGSYWDGKDGKAALKLIGAERPDKARLPFMMSDPTFAMLAALYRQRWKPLLKGSFELTVILVGLHVLIGSSYTDSLSLLAWLLLAGVSLYLFAYPLLRFARRSGAVRDDAGDGPSFEDWQDSLSRSGSDAKAVTGILRDAGRQVFGESLRLRPRKGSMNRLALCAAVALIPVLAAIVPNIFTIIVNLPSIIALVYRELADGSGLLLGLLNLLHHLSTITSLESFLYFTGLYVVVDMYNPLVMIAARMVYTFAGVLVAATGINFLLVGLMRRRLIAAQGNGTSGSGISSMRSPKRPCRAAPSSCSCAPSRRTGRSGSAISISRRP